jgi:DNA-binding response OmpR family regulator
MVGMDIIMKRKILLADDEKGLVSIMRSYFEMMDYQVFIAYNGKEVLEKISCLPDIVLLDINMPELDGLSACQRIREYISCPILFLTARIESSDKIMGFSAGADDYIVKPFDLDELGARVEAHLRREKRKQGQSTIRFFGELTINYSKREISVNQKAVALSKREFDIVKLLSMNSEQVFERDRIYEILWGIDGDGYSDTIMEHIRNIRTKLRIHTLHNYIETVWGVGYKWNG